MIKDLRKRFVQCDEQGNITNDLRTSAETPPQHPRQFAVENDADLTGKKINIATGAVINVVYAENDIHNVINNYNIFDLIQAIKDRDQEIFALCDQVDVPESLTTPMPSDKGK